MDKIVPAFFYCLWTPRFCNYTFPMGKAHLLIQPRWLEHVDKATPMLLGSPLGLPPLFIQQHLVLQQVVNQDIWTSSIIIFFSLFLYYPCCLENCDSPWWFRMGILLLSFKLPSGSLIASTGAMSVDQVGLWATLASSLPTPQPGSLPFSWTINVFNSTL